MIIDCHMHMGKSDHLGEYYCLNSITAPEYIIKIEDVAGVDKAVVFSDTTKDPAIRNRGIAEACKRYPDRLIPFCRMNCNEPNALELLVEAVEELGAKGFKFHSRGGHPTPEMMKRIIEYDIPMIIHTNDDVGPLELTNLVKEYPDATFWIAHLGSFYFNYNYQQAAIYLAERFGNVYLETSFGLHENLKEAVTRVGPEKMIFGSDGPAFHPAVERERIEVLGLSSKDKDMILGENVRKMLRLQPI